MVLILTPIVLMVVWNPRVYVTCYISHLQSSIRDLPIPKNHHHFPLGNRRCTWAVTAFQPEWSALKVRFEARSEVNFPGKPAVGFGSFPPGVVFFVGPGDEQFCWWCLWVFFLNSGQWKQVHKHEQWLDFLGEGSKNSVVEKKKECWCRSRNARIGDSEAISISQLNLNHDQDHDQLKLPNLNLSLAVYDLFIQLNKHISLLGWVESGFIKKTTTYSWLSLDDFKGIYGIKLSNPYLPSRGQEPRREVWNRGNRGNASSWPMPIKVGPVTS